MATAFNPQYVNLDAYERALLQQRANRVSPIDAALNGINQGIQLQQLPQTLRDQALERQLKNALTTQKIYDLQHPEEAAVRELTQQLTLKGALNPNSGITPAAPGTIGEQIANPGAITPAQQASLLTQDPIDFIQPTAPAARLTETPISAFGKQTGLTFNPNVPLEAENRSLQGKIDLINARPTNAILTKDGYIFDPRARTISEAPINDSSLSDQRRADADAAAAAKAAIVKDRIDSAERMLGRKLDAQELARLGQNEFKAEENEKDREIKRLTLADKRAKLAASSNPVADAQKYTDIISSIDDLSKDVGYDTVGFADWIKAIPTTPAQSFATRLEGLKAAISLGELAAMKAASKTGGSGLGAVSNYELKTLQDAKGKLNQANGPEDFKEQLAKVRASYQRLLDITKEIDSKNPNSTTAPSSASSPKIIKITPRTP